MAKLVFACPFQDVLASFLRDCRRLDQQQWSILTPSAKLELDRINILLGSSEPEVDRLLKEVRWVRRIDGKWKVDPSEIKAFISHYNLSRHVSLGMKRLSSNNEWFLTVGHQVVDIDEAIVTPRMRLRDVCRDIWQTNLYTEGKNGATTKYQPTKQRRGRKSFATPPLEHRMPKKSKIGELCPFR
jgi:hypothetical protein